MLLTSPTINRPQTLLWTGLLLCLVGCRGEPEEAQVSAEGDCSRFERGSIRVNALIEEQLDIPRQLPPDPHTHPNETEEVLRRFALHTRTVERAIDELHAKHELECKAPYVNSDRFDEVFTRVYRPHIEMVARQRVANLDLAERLEAFDPAPTAARYCRQIADELASGLREQVSICESDFDAARCHRFTRAVRAALEVRAPAEGATPSKVPAPLGDSGADARDASGEEAVPKKNTSSDTAAVRRP